MGNAILHDLDSQWANLAGSAWARRCLRRWASDDDRFAPFRDLSHLVAEIQHADQEHSTELCWLLLGLVKGGDELATRTLLQAMVPHLGMRLKNLLRNTPPSILDVDQLLVICANQAIHEKAGTRPKWPILDLSSRTYRLYRQHQDKSDRWEQWNILADTNAPAENDYPQDVSVSPTEELAALLRQAAASGVVSRDEFDVVWSTRIDGVGIDSAAKALGTSRAVVRRRRHRAEARFVEAMKAVAV